MVVLVQLNVLLAVTVLVVEEVPEVHHHLHLTLGQEARVELAVSFLNFPVL
jgi:hypothetical protein